VHCLVQQLLLLLQPAARQLLGRQRQRIVRGRCAARRRLAHPGARCAQAGVRIRQAVQQRPLAAQEMQQVLAVARG
jgi:hypothetical protein